MATRRVTRWAQELWLDPADPVHALWDAAVVLEERQRPAAARGARDGAIVLARRTLSSADYADRRTLRRRLGAAAGQLNYGNRMGFLDG